MLWAFTLNTEACGHFFVGILKNKRSEVYGKGLTVGVKSKYAHVILLRDQNKAALVVRVQ